MNVFDAAAFAYAAHAGQKRKYNEVPYITHPARVAGRAMVHPVIVSAPIELRERFVCAAWNHDVPEDCKISFEDLADVGFHDYSIGWIEEVTNTSKASRKPRKVRKQMDRDRLAKISKFGKVLKLIDRHDNVSELAPHCPWDFAELYRDETIALVEVLADADEELADLCIKSAVEAARMCESWQKGKIDA